MRRIIALVLLAMVTFGGSAAAQKKGDRYRLTQADLAEAGSSINTAYDAIQQLRPHWFRGPSGRTASQSTGDPLSMPGVNSGMPVVYIDGNRQNGIESLRTISAAKVKEVKYMDQNKAIAMLGPGHEAGAIEVTLDKPN